MTIDVVFDTRELSSATQVKLDVDQIHTEMQRKFNFSGNMSVQPMTLGDIALIDRETQKTRLLIERKGLNDYISSLQPGDGHDKRMVEQLARLVRVSGCPRILMLVGPFHTLDAAKTASLVTITARLALLPNPITIARLEGSQYIARFLARCAENLNGISAQCDAPVFEELMIAMRKSQIDSVEKYYQVILQIPNNMSKQRAQAICRSFPTPGLLKRALRSEGIKAITKIKVGKKCIPEKPAQLIHDFLMNEIKMVQ